MEYKEKQVKTKALLKATKNIKGYEFNSFPNRVERRRRQKAAHTKTPLFNTSRNIQTFIKPDTTNNSREE